MAQRKSLLAAATTLGISLVLAACAGATTTSPASPAGDVAPATAEAGSPEASLSQQGAAEAASCSAIQAWSDEMRDLTEIDPAVDTAEDVSAQVDEIRSAWDAVKASLEDIDAADEAAVVEAGRSLESSLDGFSTDVPIADAVEEIRTAGEPLRAVYRDMADGLGCELVQPF